MRSDRVGSVHVEINVISGMGKLGGFVQVALTVRNVLIQAGRGVCVHGNRSDQVLLEHF